MLTQAEHWLEIVGTAVDVLLLARVLLLRLYRLYVFITLGCVLAVLFDGVVLWLGSDKAADNVFIYSRFIYAFVFPLIAWDVFEEVKTQIAKLRKLATTRLVSGLIFACLFGFLISAFADTSDSNTGDSAVFITLALILWAGSSTATLAFLLTLHNQTRAQKLGLPNNTSVWMLYWELSLFSEVLSCFWLLVYPLVKAHAEYVQILFTLYGIAITGWCIFRLRAVPSSVPSAPAKASEP